MSDKLTLNSPVDLIKSVGEKKRDRLNSIGIFTVLDLLNHFPYRYKDKRKITPSNKIIDGGTYLVCGKLDRIIVKNIGRGRAVSECIFSDDYGKFYVSFFNMPYISKSLMKDQTYVIYSKFRVKAGMKSCTNPEYALLNSEKDIRGIIPIYHCTAGVTNNDFNKWIKLVFDSINFDDDWMGVELCEKNNICSRGFAYWNIHFPKSEEHYKTARFRIIYEQLLTYQLMIRFNRKYLDDEALDSSIPNEDISSFIDDLPFELTDGQKQCIDDIENDLISKKPMNRLIQGDVGSGKTLVAEAAIYKVVKAGFQASMMAPTEILARQHYKTLSEGLNKYGFKVGLLVSGMKSSERKEILQDIANGNIDVIVGTHAIIQKDVEFNNLGLVITDEQHRFGVNQRKTLKEKSAAVNVCVMSATPIPRTLSATVFGDMDFSIIKEKPSNRLPIITKGVYPESRERAYIALRKEVEDGHQAYVVAPSIDSEDEDLSSVMELFDELSKKFSGIKLALIHGKLDKNEKESIINGFSAGEVDILVSTTVIEVGIDVPNATIMVIENSERYGLAQMHQLRGRVGRSNLQSYCYLICYSKSESARDRMDAMVKISDGFEISEEDYRLRGPGDITGTMQSGNYQSQILSLCKYSEILDLAIEDADKIIEGKINCNIDYVKDYIDRISKTDNSDVI